MKLVIHTALQIQKPITEVFEAIVDPEKMKNYFISKGSGRLENGKEIIWEWPEFPGQQFEIKQIKVVPNQSVSFVWEDTLTVTIILEEQADKSVVVRISEGEKEADEAGIKWYGGNSEGWAYFLSALKCYVEYGINLRKGAFEFLRK